MRTRAHMLIIALPYFAACWWLRLQRGDELPALPPPPRPRDNWN
jgi:hypothetical protein